MATADGNPAAPTKVVAVLVAIVAVLAVVVATAANPEPAVAKKQTNACKKYGDSLPGNVKRKNLQKAVLCFINRERTARGLAPLKKAKPLQKAAQRYSRHMQKTKCFSHNCPGVPGMVQRLRNAGYPGANNRLHFAAENLAWGSHHLGTPRSIVRAWMNSAGHKANILSTHAKEIGVGVVKGTVTDPKTKGGVYTTDFGKRG